MNMSTVPSTDAAHEPNVVTFGCRLNIVETEVILHHAKAAGLSDFVFVNTCAVTAGAVRQAAQSIWRIRRERPLVDRTAVKERASRLRDKGRRALAKYLDSVVERDVEVLIEHGGIGRTPNFAEVAVGDGPEAGQIRLARIGQHDGRRLTGEIIS